MCLSILGSLHPKEGRLLAWAVIRVLSLYCTVDLKVVDVFVQKLQIYLMDIPIGWFFLN